MANKLKKKTVSKAEGVPLKTEKEAKLDIRQIARDERTWKIVGALSLLVSLLLFTSFISYFFTWKEDQDKVLQGASILFEDNITVSNLLGRLGALTAHFFIFKGFGVASLLICTFFFILGVNLLFERKVWSLWRNLRYVTIGMLVLSVSLAFVTAGTDFPFGGGTGRMI
ncbi:MAG: cell division protein FtsK, partial [Sphingobacteriales bacterium 12-47-4]